MRRTIFRQVQAILLVLCGMVLAKAAYGINVKPMVSVGSTHYVVIKDDGSLWYWGNSLKTDSFLSCCMSDVKTVMPVKIGEGFVKVSAGNGNTLAIKSDGTLWAFGVNNFGQLGIGNTTSTPEKTLVQVGNDNKWKDISVGYHHALGIKNDGTLWSWGTNYFGETGLGDSNFYDGTTASRKNIVTSPAQVGNAMDWQSVATGYYHSLALKTDGSLWEWGAPNGYDRAPLTEPTQVGLSKEWKSISAKMNTSAAIKTDGTLWTWGQGFNGSLGNGSSLVVLTP